MREYVDHLGIERRAPQILGRLKFKIHSHAALRAFVFYRDRYRCTYCGARAVDVPKDYAGRDALRTGRGTLVMDHVLSRRNGGLHHPSNLRAACEPCNARKSGLVDARHGK